MNLRLICTVNLHRKRAQDRGGPAIYNWAMDPFRVVRESWTPGDTREVEESRIHRQIGVEYDSYRRVYLADGHEWIVAGQIARDDGKTYYILECVA